ncbi:MAG: endonuclease/exonuclease/phosphatase family protein [Devosia sp.]|nr:endonuclease/exonuclease/phosphatase family protein [Devosia sp.]
MTILLGLLRLGLGAAVLGVAGAAIAARLGPVVPLLDIFNHLQVVLIAGLLALLVLVGLVFIGSSWQLPMLAILTAGLLSSAYAVVPETLAAFAPRAPLPVDGRPVIKLMTANLFGLNYDMERVARAITAENPDILALQEYFVEQRGPLDPMIRGTYPYSVHCVGGKRANIAIYSKLPFVQTTDGDCTTDESNTRRTAHILVRFTLTDGSTFSVLTTHLEWPLPPQRLRDQLPTLLAAIRSAPAPLLVVGDFNSTPWSHFQQQLADDAGLTRQTHGLLTFPMRFWIAGWRDTLPFLPLDQVMSKGDIAIHDIHTGPTTGSDHLPIVVTFSIDRTASATPSAKAPSP